MKLFTKGISCVKLIILLALPLVTNAQIHTTDNLQVIKQAIFASPKDTLVIFDVDFVLVTAVDDCFILMANEKGEDLRKNIFDSIFKRFSLQEIYEIYTTLLLQQKWRTVTPDTADIFNEIKAKGYKILGLTALLTGKLGVIDSMESWRIEHLQSHGISFDNSFVNAESGYLDPYIPEIVQYNQDAKHKTAPTAYNGIVFTGSIPKGEVLNAYLQYAHIKPKKIIFIDDRMGNLKSVQECCQKNDIEFLGYEYTAIQEQAKQLQLNTKRAFLQYELLVLKKIWLTDSEADNILASLEN